jgi:hypothetical protein
LAHAAAWEGQLWAPTWLTFRAVSYCNTADDCDDIDWDEPPVGRSEPWRPRVFLFELYWADQASIDAFGDSVYEHDFKLYNRDNWHFLRHPFCFGQGDNFWALQEDLEWRQDLPSDAKFYIDNAEEADSCEERDLTFGIHHPKELQPNTVYHVALYMRNGEEDSSPYQLQGQKLERNFPGCDFSPWCVNVVHWPEGGPTETYIPEEQGTGLPDCRVWSRLYGLQRCIENTRRRP